MFESLLVGVDDSPGSRRALATAEAVATAAGTPIDLVAVRGLGSPAGYDQLMLDELADGLTVSVRRRLTLEASEIADGLVAAQTSSPGSLLCLGTRAHTGVSELLLGSATTGVLHRSHRPLLLSGPHCVASVDSLRRSLLVCVDDSEAAEAILGCASEWALELSARMWLTTVMPPSNTAIAAENAHLSRLVRKAQSAHGVDVAWDVLQGNDVADTIVSHATTVGTGAIAMATHDRTRISERLLGSVALRVVHHARCPVLVARPDAVV